MLGAAALMRRHDKLKAHDLPDGLAELVEARAPRVRLVAAHQRGPLLHAHRPGAAIGQQVDIDIARSETKEIVLGRPEGLLTGMPWQKADRLNDLDSIGL